MSKQTVRDPSETLPAAPEARRNELPNADRRAEAEMARVLVT